MIEPIRILDIVFIKSIKTLLRSLLYKQPESWNIYIWRGTKKPAQSAVPIRPNFAEVPWTPSFRSHSLPNKTDESKFSPRSRAKKLFKFCKTTLIFSCFVNLIQFLTESKITICMKSIYFFSASKNILCAKSICF